MYYVLIALLSFWPILAWAETSIPGPVRATVTSIYDGDTLTVAAKPWPGISMDTDIRIRGIDTPEMRGRCDTETLKAKQARDFVITRIKIGDSVTLTDLTMDKYSGRFVARVWVKGQDLGAALVAAELAHVYDGGAKGAWCP